MMDVVQAALPLWGLQGAHVRLIAARENQVFEVQNTQRHFVMRLHRVGYRADAELLSELHWMQAAAHGGISVPRPIPAQDGAMMHVVKGVQVDVLSWVAGEPIGTTGTPLIHPDRLGLFRRIGREMARLHKVCDAWSPPAGFTRCAWDRAGLVGSAPLWGRFWDNPTLAAGDHALFLRLRDVARDQLVQANDLLDYGLIHADLVRENILERNGALTLIDFDDGGYGYRLFDVATALIKNMDEPDFPQLRDALIAGYNTQRPLDLHLLDLFMVLRAATYVGWIIQRMKEDGATTRNARFIAKTRALAQAYLSHH